MLQKTQVQTVIPYFARFMARFPDVASLARATEDEVLHCFAGLGYYTRARCLHRAARLILSEHQGVFPDTLAAIQALPGVGRSTAGAISSIAFEKAAPILEGNVKRVLSRLYGIEEPINAKQTENRLWELAAAYTPSDKHAADYTQAMMDLGALLCTRKSPTCTVCPFRKVCVAYQKGLVEVLPRKQKAQSLSTKAATFLIIKRASHVILHKRPSKGIWGGLHCLPTIADQPERKSFRALCETWLGKHLIDFQWLPVFRHTFTHYHLKLFPVLIEVSEKTPKIIFKNIEKHFKTIAHTQQIWYNLQKPQSIGLPKPIDVLLRKL